MQYKTVPGPIGVTISSKDSYDKAVRMYADIIQNEAVGGWELAFIQQIPVIKKAGCIAGTGRHHPGADGTDGRRQARCGGKEARQYPERNKRRLWLQPEFRAAW